MDTFPVLTRYVFPSIVFTIMFGMGLSLRLRDFKQIIKKPKAAIVGLTGQLLALPLIGIALTTIIPMAPHIAIGIMVLAASPGGVTSNAIIHFLRADLALSVSLTATSSLIVSATLPLWTAWALERFLGTEGAIEWPFVDAFAGLLVLTLVPVTAGMAIRYYMPSLAVASRELFRKGSVAMILFMCLTTTGLNWGYFESWTAVVTMIAYCSALMVAAMGVAHLANRILMIDSEQSLTIVIEVGVQNLAVALLVAITMLHDPTIAQLPLVYGILMISLPWMYVIVYRRSGRGKVTCMDGRKSS